MRARVQSLLFLANAKVKGGCPDPYGWKVRREVLCMTETGSSMWKVSGLLISFRQFQPTIGRNGVLQQRLTKRLDVAWLRVVWRLVGFGRLRDQQPCGSATHGQT